MNKETEQETLPPVYDAEQVVIIPEGLHHGEITGVERKITESEKGTFDYTNVIIMPDDIDKDDFSMSVGYPSKVTKNTGLGQLLMRFNPDLKEGIKEGTAKGINSEKELKGKRCTFITQNKANEEGQEFAVIIPDTVKPE